MTRIRCRDRRCVFNKNGICSAEEIEYEPDAGCLTMEPRNGVDEEDEDWEEDEEEAEKASLDDEEELEDDEDWEEDEEEDDPGLGAEAAETMTIEDGSTISIRPLKAWDEYLAAEELQRVVWQMPDWRDAVPANLMIAVNKNARLALGAFAPDGRLVGLAFGFIGMEWRAGQTKLKHHSHMLAVLPEYQSQKIGLRLKFRQREETLAKGIDLMTWMYDPLQARNANLNLMHLGAIAWRYVLNAYGEMTDGLNAGIASDRFEAEWWLNAPRAKQCAAGQPQRLEWDALCAAGAQEVFCITMDAHGLPHIESENELHGEQLLLEIPASINAVKTLSLDLAREWRARTRDVFQRAFAAGYAAVGFVFAALDGHQRAAYLLSRAPVETGAGD